VARGGFAVSLWYCAKKKSFWKETFLFFWVSLGFNPGSREVRRHVGGVQAVRGRALKPTGLGDGNDEEVDTRNLNR